MIKMQAIGRLGKDAEVKEFNSKKVINFSIAVDTGFGENKKTTWLECSYWRENVKIADYLLKGAQVHIDGEPSIRQWEANGKSGVTFQVRVDNITLVGGKSEATIVKSAPSKAVAPDIDDLPF